MRWIIWTVVVVYTIGAVLTFAMQTQMPVTFGLAMLRTAVWPLWMATGRPYGTPTWYDGGDG